MKIPTIVKEAQSALENGCCVVIGLQSTGEVQNFYCSFTLYSTVCIGLLELIERGKYKCSACILL